MPVKNLEQPKAKAARGKQKQATNSTAKSVRKAPGTRMGTLADWRSAAGGKTAGRHGRTIRDGR